MSEIIQEEVSGIVVADCIVLNKTEFPPFLETRNEKTYLNTKRNKQSGSLKPAGAILLVMLAWDSSFSKEVVTEASHDK